jgi:hypothetical protein
VSALPAAAGARPAGAVAGSARGRLPLELASFGALAAYAAGHWAALVEGTGVARTLALVAIATAGAAALALLGRTGWDARRRCGAGILVALLVLAAGLVAAGLPARLLLPGGWAELGDGLDRGLGGVQNVAWPYSGQDEWLARTLRLAAPLVLGLSAALAFFPVRRAAGVLRAGGLLALLLLYGTAVTEYDQGQPLLRGFVLLLLVAAWLWLPKLAGREGAVGFGAVVAVGVLTLPLAAGLDGERPWWDYKGWNLFGGGKVVSFDWNHSYGPLDWPRDGTTLLNVKSDRPHYWKAETLDTFDGFRWRRAPVRGVFDSSNGLPDRSAGDSSWDYFEFNRRWDESISFSVRALSTNFVVGAGTTYAVQGVGPHSGPSADGTTSLARPLEKGDSYSIRAYAPAPSAQQMRGAPLGRGQAVDGATLVYLPGPGESALQQGGTPTIRLEQRRERVLVPHRDTANTGQPDAAERLLGSSYGRAYRLARRLTAGQASSYDAVRSVERWLQRNLAYSERVPSQEVPLDAFLFEDKRGYCQQFSGAMALMLRMSGIPARVAAGFSPGSFNRDTREYRVRDLDAHSWVEVWFAGIGWVPFDPTPAAAPAESQGRGLSDASPGRANAGDPGASDAAGARTEPAGNGAGSGDGDGAGSRALGVLALVVLGLAAAGFLVLRRLRASRALPPRELGEAQLAELRLALDRLGWGMPAGTTLLALERRLARAAGPAAARYTAKLRAHRYDPSDPGLPGPEERRALRRELTARGGLRAKLNGLRVMPPGGPRAA